MIIIPESFRRSYDRHMPPVEEVKNRAFRHLDEIASAFNGRYQGRVKSIESILSKAETTKYNCPFTEMEDLYAATIAVPSMHDIANVQEAVSARFEVVEVKSHRKKNPREFVYDDLHMILRLKDDTLIRDKGILTIKFELQIKTMLQYVWWQLEHDLVYKTNRLSWQKARIFGQIKAMLDLTDRMLANIEQAAGLQEEEEFDEYRSINEISEVLDQKWGAEPKPWYDLRRTSETVLKYCKMADISSIELSQILSLETHTDVFSARSITPTQAIFIALFRNKKELILSRLNSNRILISEEMKDFEISLNEIPLDNIVSL